MPSLQTYDKDNIPPAVVNKVRPYVNNPDMAQEVMNAVFDTSTASEQLHSAGRMQGFGSTTQGGAAGGYQQPDYPNSGGGQDPSAFAFAPKVESGAYSTGRMQGFGNPNFNPKKEESKMGALASTMATGPSSAGRIARPPRAG